MLIYQINTWSLLLATVTTGRRHEIHPHHFVGHVVGQVPLEMNLVMPAKCNVQSTRAKNQNIEGKNKKYLLLCYCVIICWESGIVLEKGCDSRENVDHLCTYCS
jgi:hypothetical protein